MQVSTKTTSWSLKVQVGKEYKEKPRFFWTKMLL